MNPNLGLKLAPTSSTRAVQLSLAAGGVTLLCGLGYLAYASRQKPSRSELDIPRETVLKILKEFRREFYPLFKTLSLQSMNWQNNMRSRYQVPADEIKGALFQQLVEENPTLKPDIQEIEDRVYSKYNVINRAEFERLCVELARSDTAIQAVMLETKDLFKRAVNGVLPPTQMELPASITPQATLVLLKDTVREVTTTIHDYARRHLEEHGSLGFQDENFQIGLNSLGIDEARSRLIRAHGFDVTEDFHPQQVFTFAVTKFARENLFFSERSNLIERINQQIVQQMFTGNLTPEKFEEELERLEAAVRPESEPIIQLAGLEPIENITANAMLRAAVDLPEGERQIIDIMERQSQQEARSRKSSMLIADEDERSVRSNRSANKSANNLSANRSVNKSANKSVNSGSKRPSETRSVRSHRDDSGRKSRASDRDRTEVEEPVYILVESTMNSDDVPTIFISRDDLEAESEIQEDKDDVRDKEDIKFEEHPF